MPHARPNCSQVNVQRRSGAYDEDFLEWYWHDDEGDDWKRLSEEETRQQAEAVADARSHAAAVKAAKVNSGGGGGSSSSPSVAPTSTALVVVPTKPPLSLTCNVCGRSGFAHAGALGMHRKACQLKADSAGGGGSGGGGGGGAAAAVSTTAAPAAAAASTWPSIVAPAITPLRPGLFGPASGAASAATASAATASAATAWTRLTGMDAVRALLTECRLAQYAEAFEAAGYDDAPFLIQLVARYPDQVCKYLAMYPEQLASDLLPPCTLACTPCALHSLRPGLYSYTEVPTAACPLAACSCPKCMRRSA